jgi:hypothetical protein
VSSIERMRERLPWRPMSSPRNYYDELIREALMPVEMDDESDFDISPDDRTYSVSSTTAAPSSSWSSVVSVNMSSRVTTMDEEPTVIKLYEKPRPGCDWHTVEAMSLEFPQNTTSPLDILWRLEVRERAPRRRTQSTGERWGWLTGAYSWAQCQELRAACIYASITNPVTYLSFAMMHEFSIFPFIDPDIYVSYDYFTQRVYRSWL